MALPLLVLPSLLASVATSSIILRSLSKASSEISNSEQSTLQKQSEKKLITIGGIYGWILEGLRKEWEYTQSNMAFCLALTSKSNYYKIEKCLTEIDINQLYYFCSEMQLPILEVLILHNKICETASKLGIEIIMDKKITALDNTEVVLLSEYLILLDIAEAREIKKAFSTLANIPTEEHIRNIKLQSLIK
ncbi:hypothetical protein HLH17_10865 [Acinetobacter sp. ANC 5380]|uniref:Uncharacterized protein n=1 Tax=Acinetobacter terrae TaxID=2731247 RepID=A0A7Y2RGK3_9GAMM|nr:hypothetical protein [Acinetobacter terrae]NNH78159.1 hypothetical protein [Acinetobacter terrae]